MSFTVTFKKVFTGIEQDDEVEALDEAAHKLGEGMASQMGTLDDFFDTSVQKEPVKEVHLTVEGIKEFISENFGKVIHTEPERKLLPEWKPLTITDKQAQEFMDFLEADMSEWLKENWKCFVRE